MTWLEVGAAVVGIFTPIIGAMSLVLAKFRRHQKRIKLEKHLQEEKARGQDKGQRTIMHLTAALGMTETEILRAASASKVIGRRVGVDPDTNRANTLFFEYTSDT